MKTFDILSVSTKIKLRLVRPWNDDSRANSIEGLVGGMAEWKQKKSMGACKRRGGSSRDILAIFADVVARENDANTRS